MRRKDAPIKLRKVSAVLFDASGTLINDVYAVWQANAGTLKWLGSNEMLTFQRFKEKTRTPYWKFYGYFGIPEKKAKNEAVPKFKQIYDSLIETIALMRDTKSVLEQLKGKNITIAVVTHGPRQSIENVFKKFGIMQFIDVIIGLEDCDEQKPSPKPLLTALSRLNVLPSEAIYVGDMCEDIQAGQKAGITTFAYCGAGGYTLEERLRKTKPNHVIHDLSELLLYV